MAHAIGFMLTPISSAGIIDCVKLGLIDYEGKLLLSEYGE
jgi:hypothetical protein